MYETYIIKLKLKKLKSFKLYFFLKESNLYRLQMCVREISVYFMKWFLSYV